MRVAARRAHDDRVALADVEHGDRQPSVGETQRRREHDRTSDDDQRNGEASMLAAAANAAATATAIVGDDRERGRRRNPDARAGQRGDCADGAQHRIDVPCRDRRRRPAQHGHVRDRDRGDPREHRDAGRRNHDGVRQHRVGRDDAERRRAQRPHADLGRDRQRERFAHAVRHRPPFECTPKRPRKQHDRAYARERQREGDGRHRSRPQRRDHERRQRERIPRHEPRAAAACEQSDRHHHRRALRRQVRAAQPRVGDHARNRRKTRRHARDARQP